MPRTDEPLVDEAFRIGPNDVRITQTALGNWLVSMYPIDRIPDDGRWPGYTFSSIGGECPDGPDLESMLAWAKAHERSQTG